MGNMMDNARARFAKRQAKMAEAPEVEPEAGEAKVAEWDGTPRNRAERRMAARGHVSASLKRDTRERELRRAFRGIASFQTRQTLFWGCAVPKMAKRARLEAR